MRNKISVLQSYAGVLDRLPQNYIKKSKRGTTSFKEMMAIAEALGVWEKQNSVLSDGENRTIKRISDCETGL